MDSGHVKTQTQRKPDGRYCNPWPTWNQDSLSFRLLFAFLRMRRPPLPSLQVLELERELPVVKPCWTVQKKDALRATWIGHATVLVQFPGGTLITDPIWSERCSPVSFIGPKRARPPPCSIDELPKIDVVVISHNHYDHLDKHTVVELLRTQRKAFGGHEPFVLVPRGLREWFLSLNFSPERVRELEWWEEFEHGEMKIHCLPAQHWSRRSIADSCKTLWSSWAAECGGKKFYFAGDTGYCSEFKTIGHYLGPFDLCAIPIGCYQPWEFMRYQHIGPKKAVRVHQELRSRFSMAIHWGTYPMGTGEEFLAPSKELGEFVKEASEGVSGFGKFVTVKHGESVEV